MDQNFEGFWFYIISYIFVPWYIFDKLEWDLWRNITGMMWWNKEISIDFLFALTSCFLNNYLNNLIKFNWSLNYRKFEILSLGLGFWMNGKYVIWEIVILKIWIVGNIIGLDWVLMTQIWNRITHNNRDGYWICNFPWITKKQLLS